MCRRSVVSTKDEVIAALKTGSKNRSSRGTDMNERSSRSHLILSVYIRGANKISGTVTVSKLHLVVFVRTVQLFSFRSDRFGWFRARGPLGSTGRGPVYGNMRLFLVMVMSCNRE